MPETSHNLCPAFRLPVASLWTPDCLLGTDHEPPSTSHADPPSAAHLAALREGDLGEVLRGAERLVQRLEPAAALLPLLPLQALQDLTRASD